MKTITLTDEQFDNLFNYLDQKFNYIVDKSLDYQDSEILNEWEDLFDVHTILGETKEEYNLIKYCLDNAMVNLHADTKKIATDVLLKLSNQIKDHEN